VVSSMAAMTKVASTVATKVASTVAVVAGKTSVKQIRS
jgi:hypothetical protein